MAAPRLASVSNTEQWTPPCTIPYGWWCLGVAYHCATTRSPLTSVKRMPRWRTNSPVRSPDWSPDRSVAVTDPSNQRRRCGRDSVAQPASMGLPQPGILAVGTTAHGYVELDLAAGADRGWVTVLADLAERETTMGANHRDRDLT